MSEQVNPAFNAEQKAVEDEKSPAEKLQDERQAEAPLPGAENPESKEVKKEINPNSE
ncbi:MAG: hypothetical protein M3430_14150 [Acidobacteriota bacterium]|nr:hypothetical protein [Acidobacteriota bacterium]